MLSYSIGQKQGGLFMVCAHSPHRKYFSSRLQKLVLDPNPSFPDSDDKLQKHQNPFNRSTTKQRGLLLLVSSRSQFFFFGLVPRNRPRLIGWAFYFYKCSPIVLGKNRGVCRSKLYISPIENIFLVVPKNPF